MSEFIMRSPCVNCGGTNGKIETRGGQDCVRCGDCDKFQYNAPKTETGRAVRSVQTTHAAIKPKTRASVLLRANGHCELCGKSEGEIHVGHIISVDAGFKSGLTDAEINDVENLAAMCAECNLGVGSEPLPLRFAISLLLERLKFTKAPDAN